ncbi:hypothetical protein E4U54_001307 [Claviceps lovelessii]|nr:hypothetical protein E4U54_001307 [Claviceps lovelessii]
MKFFILSAILGVAVSAADQYADYNLVCDRNIYNGPLNGEAPFFQAFYQGLCTRLYQCGYVEVEEPGKDSTVMTVNPYAFQIKAVKLHFIPEGESRGRFLSAKSFVKSDRRSADKSYWRQSSMHMYMAECLAFSWVNRPQINHRIRFEYAGSSANNVQYILDDSERNDTGDNLTD